MRNIWILAGTSLLSFTALAQDSLKTTTLDEVVVTGTRFDVPIEKSGKTIYKITKEDLQRNAGKSLADVLQEVPGLQMDGNFGAPGSNISYYLRGARNKSTLILIDGVPLNDPSAINAEYDLRYIPISQIQSIEVFKGGLSTLYGTSAAAGVISIKLKEATTSFQGVANAEAASYQTLQENIQISGKHKGFSYLGSAGNVRSRGFSAALDNDPNTEFDRDGFSRQNALVKLGYKFNDHWEIAGQSAFEQFDADYDAYEFTDAAEIQKYEQLRFGINGKFTYAKGTVEGKIFHNKNSRKFGSVNPSAYTGTNGQLEFIHRHKFSSAVEMLTGINFQDMAFEQEGQVSSDTAQVRMFDPYSSILISLPSGFSLHAGARINTHNVYGSEFVYNINPSFLFNQDGTWRYKVFASYSTSYITPSLYQLYSIYGNTNLTPEEAVNLEGGASVYRERFTFNISYFTRDERNPIDFISSFDEEGNWSGRYQNVTTERTVSGVETDVQYKINKSIRVNAHYALTGTDKPESFYRIPKVKFGAGVNFEPIQYLNVSVKYNYIGDRKTFDYNSFSEVTLDGYQLVDIYSSYGLLKNRLTVYGSVNNLLDEDFVGVLGYTTRGRNFSTGVRYVF